MVWLTNGPFSRRVTLNIFNSQQGEQDTLLTLEIFPDMSVATLRESIQGEANVPPTAQHIYHNGRLLSDDSKTMEELQISDGEMLAVHVRDMRGSSKNVPQNQGSQAAQDSQQQAARRRPGEQDPEMIRLQVLGNQQLRQQLAQSHPELAAAVDNPARFASILEDSQDRERRERLERQREIERLNDDPFNMDNQLKIEEMIRQERVMENLQNAMEHNPEGEKPSTLPGQHCKLTLEMQYSAEYTCYTLMLRSTATRSRHWWTLAPRQPSCRLPVPNRAASCGWWIRDLLV